MPPPLDSRPGLRRPRVTRPGRMEPLARLPVFYALEGKRVLLVGGSDAAAWKAELLAATGARLHIIADDMGEEMRVVVAEHASGGITVEERGWRAADMAGAALAIGAIEDEAEGQAFAAAARAAGVPVNVVDRPHLCDFAFGSIVNRSPLVIGISTDGAAPVFGQAVRAKIEAMLPRGLTRWALAAKAWRPAVQALGLGFQQRRRFWQRFTDMAMATPEQAPCPVQREALLVLSESEAALPEAGCVLLVGAGPGDPELLTLKAVRALQSADVILYDDLVSREVLEFARREAKTMLVGKTGHAPSCRQDDINGLMVGLARQGKRVVRLKSGDPLIFGRASEEIAACQTAQIAVELVPGISTAQGAAAALGLSLTQRDHARRLQYVTGHGRDGALPAGLDMAALADPEATTVVYMPKATWPLLACHVMRAGLAPETPALAITNATRPGQHVLRATLATLEARMATHPQDGPCVILYGKALAPDAAPAMDRAASAADAAPASDTAGSRLSAMRRAV
jgi:uroporphyrin-III C-methyltransferase / precorrin-2 dehydrogenase / sirohydrochlorin ferrochelatase